MFDIPDLMRTAQDLARHSGARQTVIAQNIAQADTPGYRARDLPPFHTQADRALAATRPTHLDASARPADLTPHTDRSAPALSPNGNTVSLEGQMMQAAQTRQAHEMALSTYTSARAILRTAMGR